MPYLYVKIIVMKTLLQWTAPEHIHEHKSADWYWSVGIIAVTLAVLAILLGNIIFAIFIIISGIALAIHRMNPPQMIECSITTKGVIYKNVLLPYTTIKSFWVETIHTEPKIFITSKKVLMPHISLYIASDLDPEEVRRVLLVYVKEEEQGEPLSLRIMQRLGF
jgi:hypothetical protein